MAPTLLSPRSTVLLATDGSAAAAAAARVAFELATERGAIVHVVSVLDVRRVPLQPLSDLSIATRLPSDDAPPRANHADVVRDGIAKAVGRTVAWPVHIVLGTPAESIVREAHRLDASLIVMGLRRHGQLDRGIHDETTLSVIRRAACPVLAVTATTTELPTRALVGMDFGRASSIAARCVADLVRDGGNVVLTYVPPLATEQIDEGERRVRELGIDAAFAQCERELGEQGASTQRAIVNHKLPQSIAKLLLESAENAKADLIAAGSVRPGRIPWLLGSVTTALVRSGRRSLLIVPPMEPIVPSSRAREASRGIWTAGRSADPTTPPYALRTG